MEVACTSVVGDPSGGISYLPEEVSTVSKSGEG